MENASIPKHTRLRYVRSRDPELIQQFLEAVGVRVQIYGAPVWTGESWFLWFIPDDRGADINSVNLDS